MRPAADRGDAGPLRFGPDGAVVRRRRRGGRDVGKGFGNNFAESVKNPAANCVLRIIFLSLHPISPPSRRPITGSLRRVEK